MIKSLDNKVKMCDKCYLSFFFLLNSKDTRHQQATQCWGNCGGVGRSLPQFLDLQHILSLHVDQSVLGELSSERTIDVNIHSCSKESVYNCLSACSFIKFCDSVVVQTRDGATLVFLLFCLCWSHSLSLLLLTVFTLSASFLSGLSALIPRLNFNKETRSITTTEAHTVPDDNRVHRLYDNSTPTPNTTTTKDQHTDTSALTETNQPQHLNIQKQTVSDFFFFI